MLFVVVVIGYGCVVVGGECFVGVLWLLDFEE